MEPTFKSSPYRAFQSVFESPNWLMNVVWLTIATLAQAVYVGQIALFGWGADQLAMRSGRPENSTPDIDANRLGDYLGRGIWPFCVYFVVQLVGALFVVVPLGLIVMIAVIAVGESNGPPVVLIGVFPLLFIGLIMLSIVTVPFVIRAMACQSFQASFDLAWVRHFVSLMFWEILISGIVFGFLAIGVTFLGMLTCIGYLPAVGIVSGAAMNLLAQWYEVFLDRGGEPVAMSASSEPIIDATVVD